MSIEESKKIDYVGINQDEVALIISDHLDWTEEEKHLQALQDKINIYLSYILDGQFGKQYPNDMSKPIKIKVVSQFPYTENGKKAIKATSSFLEENHPNISISQEELHKNA